MAESHDCCEQVVGLLTEIRDLLAGPADTDRDHFDGDHADAEQRRREVTGD